MVSETIMNLDIISKKIAISNNNNSINNINNNNFKRRKITSELNFSESEFGNK